MPLSCGHLKIQPATVPAGTLLATPSFEAGWATFGLPLAPGDLPAGQAVQVGSLTTQTDVKTTWPDGSTKLAIVTCKPTSSGPIEVRTATAPGGNVTPTVPANTSIVFTVYDRFTLLGDFNISSGTLKVVLRNIAGGTTKMVADAIYIEALDGSGNPTGTNYVVDNADSSPAYVESGSWNNGGSGYTSGANWGVGHSVRITSSAAATATWTKTGLAAGTYRVSASWGLIPAEGTFGSASSKKVGYEVFDDTTSRGELPCSQVWDSGEVGGFTLGDFVVNSGTCNVRLGNDTAASGTYVAGERVALYRDGALVAFKGYNDAGVTPSGFSASGGYAAIGDANSSDVVYISAAAPGGVNTLNYQFTGLPSGTYRVAIWSPWGQGSSTIAVGVAGTELAVDAPWTVLDDTTPRGTVDVNQKTWSGRLRSTTYTATLPGTVSADTWLDGPNAIEYRYYQNPATATAVAHPALLVIWDVRCHADGTARVQVTVENTYNKACVKEVYYDVVVTIDGVTAFSETGREHFVATRWTKFAGANGFSGSIVTPDFSRATSAAAKLLPLYAPTTGGFTLADAGAVGDPDGGTPRWQILRPGGIPEFNMYTPNIQYVGPFPTWVSGYLADPVDFARRYMLETARNSFGAYPMHYREVDNELLDPTARPNFWPDVRSSSAYVNVNYSAIVNKGWRHFLAAEQSHHPQVPLIPYLLTGERYFADEMALVLTFQIVATNERLGAQMLLTGVEARAAGWSLRTVAEDAALLPDGHPAKAWGTTCVRNSVAWHQDYTDGLVDHATTNRFLETNNPITYMDFLGSTSSDVACGESPIVTANWQNTYVLYGIQRARDLGFIDGQPKPADNAILRLTAFSRGLFEQYAPAAPSDPAQSVWPFNANENELINSGFGGICTDNAAYFKNWTVDGGTAGTHVSVGNRSDAHAILACLKLTSDGSTQASVYQEFNKALSNLANAGGTTDTLSTSSSYYLITWAKISATDSAGTLIFELVDGSGNVHNSNQFTVNVSSLTTSYVRQVFTITTGSSLPAVYRLRIRFGTSPTSGRSIYIGPVAMHRVPGATFVIGVPFYAVVGFIKNSVINHATDWDQIFSCTMASSRNSLAPYPNENNFSELDLSLSIAERHGISGATTAYDANRAHPHFVIRDNFNFVRGMYG